MAKECLYERESTSLQREYMWGEHVCMFDRTRREREGQSHGGTARSRPRLSSPDCLDWLKKTNPSGQAVGWRQALLGPPPLLLLNIKLFQMIYGRSPLGDSVLFTFCSPENWLMGVEWGSLLRALGPEKPTWQFDMQDLLYQLRTCSVFCTGCNVPWFCWYVDFLLLMRGCQYTDCIHETNNIISDQLWPDSFYLRFTFYDHTLRTLLTHHLKHWGHILCIFG